MKSKWLTWALTLAALFTAGPLSAQIIGGRVMDRTSNEPIKDVIVEVLNADGRTLNRGRTDRDGFFVFELRSPGAYRIRTQRIGYRTNTSEPMDVQLRQTVQVEVKLSTGDVELEPIRVTAKSEPPHSRALEQEGFFDRERIGFGKFLTQYEIQQRAPLETSEVFRGVPGVGLVPAGGTHYNITITRGGDNCSPRIILDNMGVEQQDLDNLVKPGDIAGIEVYRGPSEIPGRWLGQRSTCGLIVIWTRRGDPAETAPRP
ncbi:MAG TPA: carboxypeptidase regulatory-like domain-containing protein [Longimicrobium sp.]